MKTIQELYTQLKAINRLVYNGYYNGQQLKQAQSRIKAIKQQIKAEELKLISLY